MTSSHATQPLETPLGEEKSEEGRRHLSVVTIILTSQTRQKGPRRHPGDPRLPARAPGVDAAPSCPQPPRARTPGCCPPPPPLPRLGGLGPGAEAWGEATSRFSSFDDVTFSGIRHPSPFAHGAARRPRFSVLVGTDWVVPLARERRFPPNSRFSV